MTFVLGPHQRADQRPVPPQDALHARAVRGGAGRQGDQPAQLHRLPRPGDAQVHGPRRASRSRRRSPTSRRTSARSYNNRANDYLAELYPGLTHDPKKKLDHDEIERELGSPRTTASPVTIEGMPTGLFENEADRAALAAGHDPGLYVQHRRQRHPRPDQGSRRNAGDGRRLRLALRDDPGGSDRGDPFESFWNRLPPPAAPRGEQGPDPLADGVPQGSLHDPAGGPVADAAIPLRQVGRRSPSQETDELANYFAARDRRRVPLPGDRPSGRPSYLAERSKGHPELPGRRLGDDDEQGLALPPVPRDRRSSSRAAAAPTIVNGPDLRQVAPRFRPGYLEEWIANPRRLVPYTAMPQNIAPHGAIQMPVPKTFENQPMEMVRAIRDTLLNYVDAVELQLAGGGGTEDGRHVLVEPGRQDVERDSVTRRVQGPRCRTQQPGETTDAISLDSQAGTAGPGPLGHRWPPPCPAAAIRRRIRIPASSSPRPTPT